MGTSKILIDGVGIDLTSDTVAANKMLSGTKAHDSNGDSVTGSIPSKAAQTYTPGASSQSISAGQYLSGAQTIAAVPSETKTVDLSMASGNQVVSATSGKWMTSVTVNKPATLIPENIKKDVNIGGVVGTMEEGGGKGGNYNIVQTIDGDNCSLAITDANTFTVIPKTVTANGTYSASADNADGYSQVTVALPVYDGSVI